MTTRSCAICGVQNEEGVSTCVSCGAPLGAETEAEAEDLRSPQRPSNMVKLIAVVAVAALLATVVAALVGGGRAEPLPDATPPPAALPAGIVAAAGCTQVEKHPDELVPGRGHDVPPEGVRYRTVPPTSGNHLGVQTFTGVFDEPRRPEVWMHNLEHGHVAVLYGESLDPQIRSALERFVADNRTLMFMQPAAGLPEVLDVVSWTRVMRCASPSDPDAVVTAVRAYFGAYVGQAPEGALPGTPSVPGPGTAEAG